MATTAKTGEYPGWNLDLRWLDQIQRQQYTYPIGIHYNCTGADSRLLLVREVAMMLVMDRLTDKPGWHVKVFDETITEKWRQEALAWPEEDLWNRIVNVPDWGEYYPSEQFPLRPENILSGECVDYCILELRQKAKYFERTGVVPTLDATFSIAKSGVLVPHDLHLALREAFARLQADQTSGPDWHPNTNETVQDLVHPSLYPLVYGRSRFLPQEVVGVEDAVDKWAGKGDVIPKYPDTGPPPGRFDRGNTRVGGLGIDKSFWSDTYQWLPANVKFLKDGGVKFTSYINNLHPTKYRDIYSTIEKLVEKALPMWDQCLAQYHRGRLLGPGRHTPRIVPENPDDKNKNNWDPKSVEEMLQREAEAPTGQQLGASSADVECDPEGEDDDYQRARWRKVRKPLQPPVPPFNESDVDYTVHPSRALRELFKETGLQIVVKLVSIELTPEKPEFLPGRWHVEGQMNEHIVGTALYYLDSENITDSHLDFRTLTSAYQDTKYSISQDGYHWMQSMYGTLLGGGAPSACLQNYGSVTTPQGRLLAFPNVFHHRVSGFRLADPTKPGHRRFIALWLVDPFRRIISTANVPPQQADWWAESTFSALRDQRGSSSLPPEIAQLLQERGLGHKELSSGEKLSNNGGRTKLPAELLDMIRKELGNSPLMTREEAEEHRLKLMKERSTVQGEVRERWQYATYNFCEH
ncbi:hypothetical protein VTK26DRAFT_2091 [Humicola hyalothermophila]